MVADCERLSPPALGPGPSCDGLTQPTIECRHEKNACFADGAIAPNCTGVIIPTSDCAEVQEG